MSVTYYTDSHSFSVLEWPRWMQPTCSNGGFLSCTLCPAWLGCVYEVDSEVSEMPILFPIDTFLNVPQTVQPVLFYPPAPQCNLCFVIQWKSYAIEQEWNGPWLDDWSPGNVKRLNMGGHWATCEQHRFLCCYLTPRQSGICWTDQGHNSSLLWLCSFLSFNWVHVNWMSSNFFAVVLGHATLQWVLCISYRLSFLVFLWRRQRLKSIM